LLLPAIINTVGGVIFLAGCRRLWRETQRLPDKGTATVPELSRTGTVDR